MGNFYKRRVLNWGSSAIMAPTKAACSRNLKQHWRLSKGSPAQDFYFWKSGEDWGTDLRDFLTWHAFRTGLHKHCHPKIMPFRDILRWTPQNWVAFKIWGLSWQCGQKCLQYSEQVVQTILHLKEKINSLLLAWESLLSGLKKWSCGFEDGIPFCWRIAPCLPVYLWLCSYITILESSVYIFYMFSCAEHETKLHSKGCYGFTPAHAFPPSPSNHVLIPSKIIDWVFSTVLDWLAILQAGLFAVAQGNHAKAGEATCQGGRERTARAGVGWEMPRTLHAWTKQTCRCIYAKSFCSEWRGTQDKQPGWDAGELSHAYGWTCSASKGWWAAEADGETGRLRGKGRGGGSPFRAVHANEHCCGCRVRLSSSLMPGGPSCFQLQRVIWVGGWVYSRYHKMVSYFLKKHIILYYYPGQYSFLAFLLLASSNDKWDGILLSFS